MVRANDDRGQADPACPRLDESALLSLARSGDQRALEALCRRNWRPVYRSFARYTRDPSEAEDLTQEVFLRALRALPQFADRACRTRPTCCGSRPTWLATGGGRTGAGGAGGRDPRAAQSRARAGRPGPRQRAPRRPAPRA